VLEMDLPTLIDRFKAFGFLYVTLDLEGYRSGKLNDVLNFKAPIGQPTAN
jgi:pyridinium-3,5-biscarboxylic acid mononucleotide sulfurtransferase